MKTKVKDAKSTLRSGWRRAERERELDANLEVCVRFLRKEKKKTKNKQKTSSLQYLVKSVEGTQCMLDE